MSEYTDFYPSWLGCSAFGAAGIRVRDQEPVVFRPTDISGCVLWLDANNQDAVNANEFNEVLSWNNEGILGGQFDLSGTEAVQYGATTVNGLNVVTFTPNAFMTGTFTLNFQGRSVFMVSRANSFPTNTAVPIFSSDTTNAQETFFSWNGSNSWLYFEGKHPSPFPTTAYETTTDYTGTAVLSEFVIAQDLSDNWTGINGTYIAPIYNSPASGYTTGAAIYNLGNFFGGLGVNANQDMCEMIIYDNPLNEQDRTAVEYYLRIKWNLQEPPPPAFTPTDISGLYLWMDAANAATVVTDVSSNIESWSNLGLAGSAMSTSSNLVSYATASNGSNIASFPGGATLEGYFQFPYLTRTAFTVFENVSDLTSISYPYINLFDTGTAGGRQLGVAYDSNAIIYGTSLCQQSYNCPASGPISNVPVGGLNLCIWAVDSNTYLSSFAAYNSLSNLNTDTSVPNLFNTNPIYYSMGSPVNGSPDFRLAEVIEYDSLLDSSQISTVANYLVNKWAISSFTA